MFKYTLRRTIGRTIALPAMLSLALAACAMHWPWQRRPAPPPQPVHQLAIVADVSAGAAAARIVQYWDRNALLLDLTAVGGEGGAMLAPIKALGWPIRLEFRVQPGGIGRLEVMGVQRVVYEVPASGAPLLLKLPPSAYRADTTQITLRWSAADDSAH
jgi:hypothetical protein